MSSDAKFLICLRESCLFYAEHKRKRGAVSVMQKIVPASRPSDAAKFSRSVATVVERRALRKELQRWGRNTLIAVGKFTDRV